MRWSEEEIENAIEMLQGGKRYSEIGLELNRTAKSIKEKLNRLGYTFLVENPIDDKLCVECNSEIKGSGKLFCGHSCSATYNNRKRRIFRYCEICNGEITGKGKRFCSHKCHFQNQKNIVWGQIENGTHPTKSDTTIYKKYIKEKYGNKCMECGWCETNPHSGRVPLELHHVDCNPDNNKLDNLQLLCPNCHALTKNWKGITSGGGRHSRRREQRRENYKNGKAW